MVAGLRTVALPASNATGSDYSGIKPAQTGTGHRDRAYGRRAHVEGPGGADRLAIIVGFAW